jgi:phage shock protein A
MTMPEHDASDPQFDRMTARLLRREALRRAAQELNTTSGPGLEDALARISAEVTAEAVSRLPRATGQPADASPAPTVGPGVTPRPA